MNNADLVAPEHFQDAMAQVAGAVSVVTIGWKDKRTGLTVTSMTSVSLTPPSLLFCINRRSSAWPLLQQSLCFGVNVLGAPERDLADNFAGRTGRIGNERFEGREWHTLKTGAPILAEALVAFDCEVDEMISRDTHEIIIGHVRAVCLPKDHDRPLLYWRRAYDGVSNAGARYPDLDLSGIGLGMRAAVEELPTC